MVSLYFYSRSCIPYWFRVRYIYRLVFLMSENEIKLWLKQLRQLFCLHKSITFTQIDNRSSFYQCKRCGYCGKLSNEV